MTTTEQKLSVFRGKYIDLPDEGILIPYGTVKVEGGKRVEGWVLPGGKLCVDRVLAIEIMRVIYLCSVAGETKYPGKFCNKYTVGGTIDGPYSEK